MSSKPSSRWNFIQQAVASVESRLDDILADGTEAPKRGGTPVQIPRETVPSKRISSELSRNNSNASSSNDRLQERLARAMAKKNMSRTESPLPGQDQPVLASPDDDASADESPEVSSSRDLGVASDGPEDALAKHTERSERPRPPDIAISSEDDGKLEPTNGAGELHLRTLPSEAKAQPDVESTQVSKEFTGDSQILSARPSVDISRKSEEFPYKSNAEEILKMREEIGTYIEQIDALQAKLQYLSKEAAESAKQAAASANSGSLEKRLFEKDEKIALLMEEGRKLSKLEMNHLSTIRKMRAQITANTKEHEAVKSQAEKAERSLTAMEDRARKAEAAGKRAEQSLAASMTSTSDLETVRRERDALQATLADMKSQLSKAHSRTQAAESKAQADQLDQERRRIAELQDDLTGARIEREFAEEKLRREIKDLQAALDREKEQARAMESDMLAEQAALESKLESFRVRAEEASAADHGHLHTKLLRQIETLQTQYATASQNWQGIESSLLSRITNLEKERDEIIVRETDLRKKLREVNLKLKSAERELDNTQSQLADMDKSRADAEEEVQRLDRRATQLEADLANALKELEDQKSYAEREMQRRLDEEKAKFTAALQIQRIESPGTSIRKNSNMGFDINHLMSPMHYERPASRRSSTVPGFDANTPPRQQSATSFRGLTNGSIAETPSVVTSMDADDFFANVPPTPLSVSQHSHRGVNDLISTSTVGAGPSVQLVERMSANVRRLESEKADSKDELLRIATQRDEARQQVVSLMTEVEEKRKIEDRLKALEKEHESLSQRHQTTLELLGEKSEQVDELKADIVDVKQMYRQLADTMK